jgi:hypothetical protein
VRDNANVLEITTGLMEAAVSVPRAKPPLAAKSRPRYRIQ